ncbi:hypothetical protein [uncultured Polaribacter sp.]|uniref:hypothetical protein n=1 Tax=uncultured Polaribacter sp. TaxID=174711 RepID=UPI0026127531|nr:hypothetical protein [uncultured Polaribacter sp.]
MSQTLSNPSGQTKSLNNDVVFQITKAQLIKFLEFTVVIAMLTLNILAIAIASPFLKELFVSQAILVLIFCIKNSKSNNITR